MRDNTQASKLLYQRLWSMAYKVLETNLANIMSAEHTQLNTPFPVTLFRVWEKPGDCSSRGDSSGISHSACVSIFDMLHSFAPRYSHPSIRHLQPFLMPGPCQTGQRHGCGHRQISHEVQMSAESETGKHEKLLQELNLELRFSMMYLDSSHKKLSLWTQPWPGKNQNDQYFSFETSPNGKFCEYFLTRVFQRCVGIRDFFSNKVCLLFFNIFRSCSGIC